MMILFDEHHYEQRLKQFYDRSVTVL